MARLPITHGAVVVVDVGVLPLVADLVGERLLVQLDAKARAGGQVDGAVP
jgi:hypothetical protein